MMQMLASVAVGIFGAFSGAMDMLQSGAVDINALTQTVYDDMLAQSGLITLISGVLTLLVLWFFYRTRGKKLTQEIELAPLPTRAILPTIFLAFGLSLFIGAVLNMLPEDIINAYVEASDSIGDVTAANIIASVIVAPIAEEVVFRGLVYTRLRRAMPVWVAVLISSLIFGMLHGQIVWIVYATVLGIIMALVFERTGSLHANILLHMVFNIIGGYVLFASLWLGMLFMAVGGVLLWRVGNVKKLPKDTGSNEN